MLRKLAIAAAIGATAVMLLSVSSAAASAILCSNETYPCTGTKYGSGTKISASLESSVLSITSSTSVSCKKSTLGGATTTAEGHGEITSWTFGECATGSGTPCTVKAVNLNYTMTMTDTGWPSDDVTITKSAATKPGMTVECGSFINCTFTATSFTLATENAFSRLEAFSEPLGASGFLCPAPASWGAVYRISSPAFLYIV